MPKGKSTSNRKQGRRGAKKPNLPPGIIEVRMHGGWSGELTGSNGTQYEYQRIRNPYVPGEREKMLEKREKLTLEAFKIAYENHHQRKRT
ncbi:MAG TPA: hypothetical protein VNG71_18145 [Pyrinomonadaceae bacterium]|nr:hypothetical protein [Pyrinomonadaceae bacterium]